MPTIYHRTRCEMVGTLPPSLFELRRDKFALPTPYEATHRELICFACKRNFMQRSATNWHDGQIT